MNRGWLFSVAYAAIVDGLGLVYELFIHGHFSTGAYCRNVRPTNQVELVSMATTNTYYQ